MLRRAAALGAVAIAALWFSLVHAGAASADTYLVCAPGTSVPGTGTGPSCVTLATAIADAAATQGSDTIEMLPGTYCPIVISTPINGSIRFVGVGLAGFTGNVLDGPEAGLTTFENSVLCGGTPQADVDIEANEGFDTFTFENMTFDATGIPYGLYDFGWTNFIVMRDDIVQNAASSGIRYDSGCCSEDFSFEFDNGAIINNSVGAEIFGFASIYDSTVSGNSNVGLSFQNSDVSLSGDTIALNREGVDASCCGNTLQVVDTIVGANTLADCPQSGDWESPPSDSWNNLLESTSFGCPKEDTTDTVVSTLTVPTLGPNGGPTPSILTPTQADGLGAAPCGLNGRDQREDVVTSLTCDVGSVQSGVSTSSTVNVGNVALGTVTTGTPASGNSSVSLTGAGLVGISGVSISGAGWSIADDGCTFWLLESALGNGCNVNVSLTATHGGSWPGTLTFHTTSGDVSAALSAQAARPPLFSSFAPMHGPVGTSVTISGFHFTGATAVAFNGTPAASFTVNNDNSITATVATGTTTGAVTVTGPGGVATSLHDFTVVVPPPTVTGFTPLHGVIGVTVSLNGSHFTGVTGVSFNTTPAVTFTVMSDTVIDAVVPAGTTTGHIAVTGPGGVATSVGVFTVLPKITSFTPTSGPHGTHVTIHGSGFTGATTVAFHGQSAVFTVVNDTTISATVPAGATTGHLFVTTPGGTAASVGLFTIP